MYLIAKKSKDNCFNKFGDEMRQKLIIIKMRNSRYLED
jgi:hypothetical protein